jgi:vacuolar-type H+-ATPase subunit I/STV1
MMIVSSLMGGMDGIVHLMEYGLGMLSHTVSYARIFALITVHEILSVVFFRLIPSVFVIYFPPVSIFGVELIPVSFMHEGHAITPQISVLGAIVGTLIVGSLEGILAFMQALRLHFVEWFSKFFHAGGMAFKPLKIMRIHTIPKMPISSIDEQVAT